MAAVYQGMCPVITKYAILKRLIFQVPRKYPWNLKNEGLIEAIFKTVQPSGQE